MEKITLKDDIKTFGFQVTTFPHGIAEAFDQLAEKLGGFNRAFYGISYMKDNKMVYYALAEEWKDGEAQQFGMETKIISKGKYLSESLSGWHEKIPAINKTFHALMNTPGADPEKPAIEWYKNDDEMVCLLQMKDSAL